MKKQCDMTNDLVLCGILEFSGRSKLVWVHVQEGTMGPVQPADTDEELRDTLNRMLGQIENGAVSDLASLLGLPARASIWIRDSLLRALVQSMKDVTVWQRCASAKSVIDRFFESDFARWQAHISRYGRRPAPSLRPQWLTKAVSDMRVPPMDVTKIPKDAKLFFQFPRRNEQPSDESLFQYLLAATAQGQPIPRTQRGIYNIANAPTNKLVQTIESDIVRKYYEATRS